MTYAEATAILEKCNHEHRDIHIGGQHVVCYACHVAFYAAWRQARKAQLAEAPRCQINGCRRRGTLQAMGLLLCGRHFANANRAHLRAIAGGGIIAALSAHYTPEEFAKMAAGAEK